MFNELVSELDTRGANLVRAVDISMLTTDRNQGYPVALLIGMALSPGYIDRISKENIEDYSEFAEKENRTDRLAEWAADFIKAKRYTAFAQSETNLGSQGFFHVATKTSPLPHKAIALMAGLGWIGKNNLLVTPEYGSALCMCTVLTDAPLPTENKPVLKSQCSECNICKNVCQVGAIHGLTWELGMDRDLIVDVYRCTSCLKCMAVCPWTQKYASI